MRNVYKKSCKKSREYVIFVMKWHAVLTFSVPTPDEDKKLT